MLAIARRTEAGGAGGFSRRQVMAMLAAAGAGAALPAGQGAAASAAAAGDPRRIDVHHHILPPIYKTEARDAIIAGDGTGQSDKLFAWSPAQALEAMDQHGIATAMTSVSTPGIWFGDAPAARKLARGCNDYAAEMVRDHPGRFGLFAAVPLPDQEGSLREIEYALDTLKADGVALMTSYGDKWPGDPAFRPAFEELNRRKAVVFVHPTAPNCCSALQPGVHKATVEFVFDTTRAIVSFLVNGTFSSFPDIRFIFCHAGGTVMPIAYRINSLSRRYPKQIPHGVFYELKRLHYDIASQANPPAIAALRSMVPLSQILFGTDNPYVPAAVTAEGMDKFGFTAEEARAINRENALALFPRLKA